MINLYTSLLSKPQALSGTVRTLCHGVTNAENLVISNEQRVFVSGRDGVYELLASPGGKCHQKLIPLRVEAVPGNCMKNGVALRGNYLYLACAHVEQGGSRLLKAALDDVNETEQSMPGLLKLSVAALTFGISSWIVRCDLRQTPLAFTELVASLPGHTLANGISFDPTGDFIYVANSAPGVSTGIFRAPVDAASPSVLEIPWSRPPGCKPNGLKVTGRTLYFTGNATPAAVFGSMAIQEDGSAGEPQVIDTAPLHLFDDFAIVRQGFVLAQFSDAMGLSRGSLRLVSRGGRHLAVLKHREISRPSALAVASAGSELFATGDVLVVDKGTGCVVVFTPDEMWRDWLQAGPL